MKNKLKTKKISLITSFTLLSITALAGVFHFVNLPEETSSIERRLIDATKDYIETNNIGVADSYKLRTSQLSAQNYIESEDIAEECLANSYVEVTNNAGEYAYTANVNCSADSNPLLPANLESEESEDNPTPLPILTVVSKDYSETTITNKNVHVTIVFSHPIETITGDSDWEKLDDYTITKTFKSTPATPPEVTVTGKDNVGNETVVIDGIPTIDKVAPKDTEITQSNYELTNEDVTITFKLDEPARVDNANPSAFTPSEGYNTTYTYVAKKSGKVTLKVVDEAGNVSYITHNVTNIDKEGPEYTEITQSNYDPTNENVTVTFKLNEPAKVTNADPSAFTPSEGYNTTYTYVAKKSGTITLKVEDEAGNVSYIKHNVTNIDKDRPKDTEITQSNYELTNEDVTVTFKLNEPAKVTNADPSAFTPSEGYNTTYTYVAKKSGTITLKVEDEAGNVSYIRHNVTNIDKKGPEYTEITQSNYDPTNEDVTVTFKLNEPAKVTNADPSAFTPSEGYNKEYTYVAKKSGVITLKVEDEAGNVSYIKHNVTNIDKEAPKDTEITQSNYDLTDQPVTITFTLNEEAKVDNANPSAFTPSEGYNTTYTYVAKKSGVVTLKVIDRAGNVSYIRHTVTNIDTQAPTITVTDLDGNTHTSDFTITVEASQTETFTPLTYVVSDDISTNIEHSVTNNIDLKQAKEQTLIYTAKDEVGRVTTLKVTVIVEDKKPPVVDYNITSSPNATGWYKEDVKITVSASDAQTAIKKVQYQILVDKEPVDGWKDINNNTFSISENSDNVTFAIKAIDNANNETIISSTETLKIDTVKPTATLSPVEKTNAYGWYTQDFNLNIDPSENGSGLKSYKYSISLDDGKNWSNWTSVEVENDDDLNIPISSESRKLKVKVILTDNAGNDSLEIISDELKLDKIAPVITVTDANGQQHTTDFEVTMQASNTATLEAFKYTVSDNVAANIKHEVKNNVDLSKLESQTIVYTAKDEAGRTTTLTVTVNIIDTTKPTINYTVTPSSIGANWYNKDVEVSVNAQDSGTSVKSVAYLLLIDGKEISEWTEIENSKFTITNNAKNITFKIRAIDEKNNETILASNEVFHIDTQAPTMTIYDYEGNAYTENFEVNIASSQTATFELFKYKITDNMTQVILPSTRSNINLKKLGKYYITYTAEDNVGNQTKIKVIVNVVDLGAPSINHKVEAQPNANGWYNKNVKVTFSATDVESSVKSIEFQLLKDGNIIRNWTVSASGTFTITTQGKITYKLRATDTYDNQTVVESESINIDKTDPTATIEVANPNSVGWYTDDVKVGITPSDTHSQVNQVLYSLLKDNTTTWTEWQPLEITEDMFFTIQDQGKVKYKVKVIDLAGNESAEIISDELKIDKKPPVITVTDSAGQTHTSDFTIEVSASATGEFAPLEYVVTDNISTNIKKDVENNVDLNEAKSQTLVYTAEDEAGNPATLIVTVLVTDKKSPTLNYSITQTPNANGWYKDDVKANITASDAETKIAKIEYLVFVDGNKTTEKWQEVKNNTFTISEEGANVTFKVKATDAVGNETTIDGATLKIDKSVPSLTVKDQHEIVHDDDFNNQIEVSQTSTFTYIVEASDTLDKKVTISQDKTLSLKKTGTYTVTYTATDAAGNSSSIKVITKIVDTTKPQITLNGNATITQRYGKPYEELGVTIKDNSGENITPVISDNIDITKPGTYTVTYTATDSNGNYQTATRTVTITSATTTQLFLEENNCQSGADCYNTQNDANYIWYSGRLWRVIKVNANGTVKMITEESVAGFSYDDESNDYLTSNAGQWLNSEFYGALNNAGSIVVKSDYCHALTYNVADVRKTCDTKVNTYVGLLTLDEYNILGGADSFVNNGHKFFTMTPATTGTVWIVETNGTVDTLLYKVTEPYAYRPVITIKSTTISSGSGTVSDPYRIAGDSSGEEGSNLTDRVSGEYVNFAGNRWRIVTTSGTKTRLILDSYLMDGGNYLKTSFGDSLYYNTEEGIGKFLNTTYYNKFTSAEKAVIVKDRWYNRFYEIGDNPLDTTMIASTKYYVDAYVGLIRVGELMSGTSSTSKVNNFTSWSITPYASTVWHTTWAGTSSFGEPAYLRGVKPVINLNYNVKIASGDGTNKTPYELSY